MSGTSPTRQRERKDDAMPAWDDIFPQMKAEPGTERLQAQHKALWEHIRKRGGNMTEAEEKELNRLFVAVYPKALQDRAQDQDLDIETEQTDDDDPLKDLPKRQPKSIRKNRKVPSMNSISQQQKIINQMGKASNVQPPIVYAGLGLVCGGFWALGTSVQVLTSEAWMMAKSVDQIGFTAFGQLIDACRGMLPPEMWIPFTFGWGVQIALIVAAVGVELPRRPAWRWWLSIGSSFGLIIANSCGDFASSVKYGFWGQLGFTTVIFFLTFVMMLFTIMAFRHAFALAKRQQEMQQ